jgi:RNA polymerase subunit RPABC4/transcription elongation factor Spt4
MLLAIWEDGVWQDALVVGVIGLAAYLLVMWIAALVWTYRDIQARTRDNFTQAICLLIVLVFNLPGLLLYLVLRPKDTLSEMYDRQLEAEALLHEIQEQAACPSCRRKVDNDFIVCPYCRSTLRTACEECSKPLTSGWVLCPYCGTEQSPPAAAGPDAAGRPAPLPPRPQPMSARVKRPSTATYTPPASTGQASPADSAPDAGS